MTANPEQPTRLTLDEYLLFESISEGRHELRRGEVIAMAGGSERHDIMVHLIELELGNALRMSRCRVFAHNRKVITEDGDVYYPDILVRCGPAASRLFETDATWIVEVVSPSNTPRDLAERLSAYRRLASIQKVIFVDMGRQVVTMHHRLIEGWSESQPATVDIGPVMLDFTRLWEEVDHVASTQ